MPSITRTFFSSKPFPSPRTCAAPNSNVVENRPFILASSPSDVKRDRETTVNSKLQKQCSKSCSGLFRELIKNRDSNDLSSLNWITRPSTFFSSF